jgi:purine-nucleoside phosphorylase
MAGTTGAPAESVNISDILVGLADRIRAAVASKLQHSRENAEIDIMVSGEVILEAKRRVIAAKRRGLLFSPNDIFADRRDHSAETLWSIANKVGIEMSCSSEDICAVLERLYPNYTINFQNYAYNKKNREYYSDDIVPDSSY